MWWFRSTLRLLLELIVGDATAEKAGGYFQRGRRAIYPKAKM